MIRVVTCRDTVTTQAVPVEVDLSKIFAEAGLKITDATETTLTANAPYDASRLEWKAEARTAEQKAVLEARGDMAFEERVSFEYPKVTIRPMEVRTFLAHFK